LTNAPGQLTSKNDQASPASAPNTGPDDPAPRVIIWLYWFTFAHSFVLHSALSGRQDGHSSAGPGVKPVVRCAPLALPVLRDRPVLLLYGSTARQTSGTYARPGGRPGRGGHASQDVSDWTELRASSGWHRHVPPSTPPLDLLISVALGRASTIEIVASPVLLAENSLNPDPIRLARVREILANLHWPQVEQVSAFARGRSLTRLGFAALDAQHVAWAEAFGAVLLSTDDRLLALGRRHRRVLSVELRNPVPYLQEVLS